MITRTFVASVRLRVVLAVALPWMLAGCGGGGDEGPTCSFTDPPVLVDSSWPKFHHDQQNTGSTNACLSLPAPVPAARPLFPVPPDNPKGIFEGSPVFGVQDQFLYVGSLDGTVYGINLATGSPDRQFPLTALGITSSPLVASRSTGEGLFVGGGDGVLYAVVTATGAAELNYWPFPGGQFIGVSPAIGVNGIIYAASLDGSVFGVCANGIAHFHSLAPGVGSSPAVAPDGTVYFGADDGQLRAVNPDGVLKWVFAASAPIIAAPAVEPDGSAIYVADVDGHVYKVGSNGRPFPQFAFAGPDGGPVGPIQSSPALASQLRRLYFGSDDGHVYAIDADTGAVIWSVPTNGRVRSSPAVATGGGQAVVVVGSEDGNLYFISDGGAPVAMPVSIGAPVRSSPAIAKDGTVYVGADDGRVYVVGAACSPPAATPTATPQP